MALARLSAYLIPLLLAGAAVYALGRRVDVFSALTTGAGEGLRIVLRILPPLVALLTAVYMLRASGALDGLMEKQFSAARLLLWGGMIERQPETTLAEAGVRISEHMARGGTLEQVIDMCAEALRRAGFFGPAA